MGLFRVIWGLCGVILGYIGVIYYFGEIGLYKVI